jgi:hypothetical protein
MAFCIGKALRRGAGMGSFLPVVAVVSPTFVAAFADALHQFKQTEAFRAIYGKYFPGPYEPPVSRSRRRQGENQFRFRVGSV